MKLSYRMIGKAPDTDRGGDPFKEGGDLCEAHSVMRQPSRIWNIHLAVNRKKISEVMSTCHIGRPRQTESTSVQLGYERTGGDSVYGLVLIDEPVGSPNICSSVTGLAWTPWPQGSDSSSLLA